MTYEVGISIGLLCAGLGLGIALILWGISKIIEAKSVYEEDEETK